MKLYHVSNKKLPNDYTMVPRVPESEFEEQKTKRICFAPTIQGCLIGAFEDKDLTGEKLYVYSIEEDDYYEPTKKEVADVAITGEVWVLHDVKPTYEGTIIVKGIREKYKAKIAGETYEVPVWSYVGQENDKLLTDVEYYYNKETGTTHAIVEYKGKRTRLRSGVLIIKDGKVLVSHEKGQDELAIPGGGLERNETPIDAGIRECQEEVHINIKNCKETEHNYCTDENIIADWVKEHVPENKQWVNYYTFLLIADYDSEFDGKVEKIDQDKSMLNNMKWVKIDEAVKLPTFRKEWKAALKDAGYLKKGEKMNEGLTAGDVLRDVISVFGIIQNPKDSDASYVLPSGRLLDTKGTYSNHQHENVADYISKKYNCKDIDANNGSKFMTRTVNAVRLTPWLNAFYIPEKPLTDKQQATLKKFIASTTVSRNKPLMISNMSGSEFMEITTKMSPDMIMAAVMQYYIDGHLMEELSESLLNEDNTLLRYMTLTPKRGATFITPSGSYIWGKGLDHPGLIDRLGLDEDEEQVIDSKGWIRADSGLSYSPNNLPASFIELPKKEITEKQYEALLNWMITCCTGDEFQISFTNGDYKAYDMDSYFPEDLIDIIKYYYKQHVLREDLKDDAKKYFGTVGAWNWREAFYINTDGTLLDGSGRKLGNSSPSGRAVDHREISDIFTGTISGDDAMLAYMSEGNIRLMPETCGIEIMKEPTDAQYEMISKLIRYFNNDYIIEICAENGIIMQYNEYQRPTAKAILDIKDYFHKSLNEEYLDDEKEIYTTTSAYDAANRIKSSTRSLRILWDKNYDRFFLCDANDYIHRDMLELAIKLGYYGGMKRWEIDNYIEDDGEDMPNLVYYVYAPNGKEKDTWGADIDEDGYEGKFVYPFGVVTTRTDWCYKDTPLATALGKYKAHFVMDGWSEDGTRPVIKQVESLKLNEVWPNKGESKKDFIARFMKATKDEYPDIKQRFAVCMSYWDRRKTHEDLLEDLSIKPNGNLYITGIQGSGKSTLAQKYADTLNWPIIHLDDFFKKYSENELDKAVEDYVRKSNNTSGNIIEGVQLLDLLDLIDTKKHTVILLDKPEDIVRNQLYNREKDAIDNGEFFVNDTAVKSKDEFDNLVDYSWSKDLINKARQDKNIIVLTEDTRTALMNKSRTVGPYKDQSHGKNRFDRKKFSKVANAVKAYNQIDMNDFFKKDTLIVKIPVQGETDQYTVSIKMEGVLAEIAKNVKNNKNKFEFRTVIQALTKVFNTTNVYVNCTCPDYLYNFDHWNIVNNVSTSDTAHDPGPGKNIRNPHDDKGRGCKHVLLVLNNGDWLMKVASVINNYTHYAEEHMQKAFLKLIFPKIYGIPADEMVTQDLIDDDSFLDSSKGLIDAINAYGAKRGQYKPGSNKNPTTGTGGRVKKPEEETK